MTPSLRPKRRLLALAAAAATALAVAAPANAADPEPMHIIVGYAPGGAADSLARLYAEQLRQDGHGTVVVENRPGASARLALDYVKRARPDGKTVFIGPSPLFTIFPLTKDTAPGTEIRLRGEVTEASVHLIVEDDGPGVPAAMARQVFEKFTRGERESVTSGVGLGLAVCEAIVQAHGGSIRVEPVHPAQAAKVDGAGARFVVTLPRGTPPVLEPEAAGVPA